MPSSVQAFRDHGRTLVTLPSGLCVLIRPCHQFDWLGQWELPLPTAATPAAPEPERAEEAVRHFYALADTAIVKGALDPPFQPRGLPEHPERVSLEDLSNDDYLFLAQAVLQHSGLAPEVAQQLEAFRQDIQRPAGADDGGALPRAAASGAADDASGILPERADYGPEPGWVHAPASVNAPAGA
jgi:hypothetical protein